MTTDTLWDATDETTIYQQLRPTRAWQTGTTTVWYAGCCGSLLATPDNTQKPVADCPNPTCDDPHKPTRWRKVRRPYGPFIGVDGRTA